MFGHEIGKSGLVIISAIKVIDEDKRTKIRELDALVDKMTKKMNSDYKDCIIDSKSSVLVQGKDIKLNAVYKDNKISLYFESEQDGDKIKMRTLSVEKLDLLKIDNLEKLFERLENYTKLGLQQVGIYEQTITTKGNDSRDIEEIAI